MFPNAHVIAVGVKAHDTLESIGISAPLVPHPSRGSDEKLIASLERVAEMLQATRSEYVERVTITQHATPSATSELSCSSVWRISSSTSLRLRSSWSPAHQRPFETVISRHRRNH